MTVGAKIERVFLRICKPSRRRKPESHSQHGESTASKDKEDHQDSSSALTSSSDNLCDECSKLDFRSMLEEETPEQAMGPLSDHLHVRCPFCHLISEAIRHHWGPDWSSSRLCSESDPIPKLFIQSRSPVASKEHGYIEYPEPRLLLALDVTPPGFSENRPVIREVDRVKDRHIIAEIESIPGEYSNCDPQDAHLIPRREVGSSIDYDLVKRWLRDCKRHSHTQKARDQMVRGAIDTGLFNSRCGFRLIDVKDECLVLRKEPCAFAALSYVWGRLPTILDFIESSDEVPILLTTKSNLERLSTPKGLSASSIADMGDVRLPQTVIDAMEVARRIDMRYLWIDTLCIVQDDKKDKAFLIGAMDDVYDVASVTFIAASGANANAGLRGVSPRTGRPMDSMTIIDDGVTEHLSLSPPSLGEEVRNSVWNTRGWTFQEQALSQRCLYFTDEEVFFNCLQLQWREAYALETTGERTDLRVRTGPPWWNRKLRKDPDPTPYHYLGDLTGTLTVEDYQAAVQDYSRKTLSYSEDVLLAFEGVFNRFNKGAYTGELSLQQTQGIPVNHLHQALLWFPSGEAAIRQCAEEADEHFSSWSWASWDGPIEFVFADSMWLSRNITQAPLKKIPIHVLIPCWYYGATDRKFYSQDIWRAASENPDTAKKDLHRSCLVSKSYAKKHTGVDMDMLLARTRRSNHQELQVGELGFVGAYLDAGDVSLSATSRGVDGDDTGGSGRVSTLEIGPHRGEFRFDQGWGEVDEYVAVVTSDTITKPPDTQSILLGLATQDGVSRRVGIGWVYYAKDSDAPLPSWKYKFFRVG